MKRFAVNKSRSAKKFRGDQSRTKAANVKAVMRGGFRL